MEVKIKLQHYVPQFYLANFVIRPKKSTVYCYDKPKSKSFLVSVKNIASETYFYDKEKDSQQTIEKAFSVLEGSFKPIYDKVLSSGNLDSLTETERQTIALFVATQELRTREHRETIADMLRQAKARLYKENLTEEFKQKYEIDKWDSEEQIKSLHLVGLKQASRYAEYILNMKWILFGNRTRMPFWTSDHPINRFNQIDAKPYGNLGLLSKGIEIHYPLNPKIVLSFYDSTIYQNFPSRNEIDDLNNVVFENWLQVANSTRYIFSNMTDFALAQKILKENPQLKEIDRKRIQVD